MHILLSLLWDYVHTVVCESDRGECVTTGGLYRPTHLCVAHFELHKISLSLVFSLSAQLSCSSLSRFDFLIFLT